MVPPSSKYIYIKEKRTIFIIRKKNILLNNIDKLRLRNSTILLEKGRTILFYGFGLVIGVLCGAVWMVMILGKLFFYFFSICGFNWFG